MWLRASQYCVHQSLCLRATPRVLHQFVFSLFLALVFARMSVYECIWRACKRLWSNFVLRSVTEYSVSSYRILSVQLQNTQCPVTEYSVSSVIQKKKHTVTKNQLFIVLCTTSHTCHVARDNISTLLVIYIYIYSRGLHIIIYLRIRCKAENNSNSCYLTVTKSQFP